VRAGEPPYVTPRRRSSRRPPKRTRRRGLAVAAVVIVLAAASVALAFTLPGYLKTAGSTSTSSGEASSSSTTGTLLAGSTTLRKNSTTLATTSTTAASSTYSAALSGTSEVPSVATSASGSLTLTVAANGSSVHYDLRVSGITDLTVARLHEGGAGATGTTIITLYGGPTRTGLFSGILTQGSFTASQFVGPLKGKTIADFVALMKSGKVYLNVGTSAHITGEIRGQLK
jgi:hypothetical protein